VTKPISSYTGFASLKISLEQYAQLVSAKYLEVTPAMGWLPQNIYLALQDEGETCLELLGRVYQDRIVLLKERHKLKAANLKPLNREQHCALDALLDDRIQAVVLTGKAGTGKSIMALAAAIQKVEDETYNKIILIKPMSHVGKYGLGYLPGDVEDKYLPYLENYMCNIEHLISGRRDSIEHLIERYNIQFVPLQLIRGASWANAIILADEVQVLGADEMVALGTRVGKDSKIIIMGDLGQRDEAIPRDKTGIYMTINHPKFQASPLSASLELIQSERGEICSLFADVFERT
jgi:PhoH-like ATPase